MDKGGDGIRLKAMCAPSKSSLLALA